MRSVTIDNIPATVIGAALAPGAAGLYQIAIQGAGFSRRWRLADPGEYRRGVIARGHGC